MKGVGQKGVMDISRIQYVFIYILLLTTLYNSDALAQQTVTLAYDLGTYSFVIPDGVSSIAAEGWGGGGGGGYSSDKGQTTGGGGGGAYAQNTSNVAVADENLNLELTVGDGGSGNLNRKDGELSVVKISAVEFLKAIGGKGVAENSESGGLGGQAIDCYPVANAKNGGNGGDGNGNGGLPRHSSGGGGGSGGSIDDGGNGQNGESDSSGGTGGKNDGGNGGKGSRYRISGATNANDGIVPGGGGGGGKSPNTSGEERKGGDGGAGRIRIFLTLTAPDILINGNNCVGTTLTSSSILGITSYHWERDGKKIGGNTSSLNTSHPGIYTVMVTYTFDKHVYGVSANSVSLKSAPVSIYPIPAPPIIYRVSNSL